MLKFGVRNITAVTYFTMCTLIHNESKQFYIKMFTRPLREI